MNSEIWRGTVDGETVRIMQIDTHNCIVELSIGTTTAIGTAFYSENVWDIANDELASHAYMQAFLEIRQKLSNIGK